MHYLINLYFLKVYSRLQKACLCLSHKSTVSLVDKLGANFDVVVINWKDKIFDNLIEVRMLKVVIFMHLCN